MAPPGSVCSLHSGVGLYKEDAEQVWGEKTSFHMRSDHTPLSLQDCSHKNNSLIPSAPHLPASSSVLCISACKCRSESSSPATCSSINVQRCGPNPTLFSHTAWPYCSTGILWTLHFITLTFYWLGMFFCLSNGEINCPGLAFAKHLIFCSVWWSAFGNRRGGHKEVDCSASCFWGDLL